MSGLAYGIRLYGDHWQRWLSVKSHVLGQMGINEKLVGNFENFVKLTNDIYDLSITLEGVSVGDAVSQIHDALHSMSKSARRKLRKRNVGKIGYEVKPHGKVVERAALKASKSRKSKKKEAAREAYRAKHLVLVTKDGQEVFDNVRQHSSQRQREDFYRSWDWRTLRMKVIKKFGRRCQCCGATPDDLTVSGAPVRLVVDHIKPLSKYWQLRLAPTNLQVLCDECNQGKGAWDEADYRSESERLIAQQLRYEVA